MMLTTSKTARAFMNNFSSGQVQQTKPDAVRADQWVLKHIVDFDTRNMSHVNGHEHR